MYCWHFKQDLDTQDLSQNQLYWLSLHTQTSSLSLMCCVLALWGEKYQNVTSNPYFSSFHLEKAIWNVKTQNKTSEKWQTEPHVYLIQRKPISFCYCKLGVTIFRPALTVKMPPNSDRTAANATPVLMSLALLAVISCFCPTSAVGRPQQSLPVVMTVTGWFANAKAKLKMLQIRAWRGGRAGFRRSGRIRNGSSTSHVTLETLP